MYHYDYVTKKEAAPYKKDLIDLIHEVQIEVSDGYGFTFQPTFIGSSSRNMITYDPGTNVGFDFDVDLEVNAAEDEYSAKEIRNALRRALEKCRRQYGYNRCEDSTRVITLKVIDCRRSKIQHSCDFAIVRNCKHGKEYIHYNKACWNDYTWEDQGQPYKGIEMRVDWLKRHGCWMQVREAYLDKKNSNMDMNKRSRALYAETINECYDREKKRRQHR